MDLPYDVDEINKRLTQHSYICGYLPSKFDIELSNKLGNNFDMNKYVHIKRWWYHMRSFSESEISSFPATPPPNSIKWSESYKNFDEQVCEKLLCHNVDLGFSFI